MAKTRTGSTPTTLQASDFPQTFAPHAKYKANFAGNGTPAAPYIGGWVVDGRALSHDPEAQAWLKGQGFQHRGRRWLRIDRTPAMASGSPENCGITERATPNNSRILAGLAKKKSALNGARAFVRLVERFLRPDLIEGAEAVTESEVIQAMNALRTLLAEAGRGEA
jgi:hypothetical protein